MALHLHWRPSCRSTHPVTVRADSSIFNTPGLTIGLPMEPNDFCFPVESYAPGSLSTDSMASDNSAPLNTDGDNSDSYVCDGDDDLPDVVIFPQAYTNAQQHEVELLKIIHSIGGPNHCFELIMVWAQSAASKGYDFQPTPKTYERQIKHLECFVGMESCRPSHVTVPMYPQLRPDDTLDVVVFDFPTMLASLFNCPILNKIENLVVDSTDRYGRYHSPDGCLGEVNSGKWYDIAYKNLVKNPDTDFLCPIIFTMDKTVISVMGGLSVYVILFTTSIFNRQVCSLYDDHNVPAN
jgi:hypothetical protein